ncbi:MAG: histidine kinase [candidate division KSB1 bacterium]|nr:histidine kinase [candidate division KSB1 bacterium]
MVRKPFKDVLTHFDPSWIEHGYGTRFQGFQNLMRQRIRDILLVSSLYDLYVFEEDGRLYELLREEYQKLMLSHAPEFTRVSSGREALSLIKEEKRFDLILISLHIEDMNATTFAKMVRESGLDIPVVLLAYDNRELADLLRRQEATVFDRVFMWQGDFRLLIAIIKTLEDQLNVDHDTRIVGIQSIIFIEDNVRFYSTFLPIMYLELLTQAQRLISEGINLSHKNLRTRARPKILHATTYEEAWDYFKKYQEHILGVISDVDFPRQGKYDAQAGLMFAENVLARRADVPILLQSNLPENEPLARALGASFLLKTSPNLAEELRSFMAESFSFGDFIFRTPDGRIVGRAQDLISLEEQIKVVPEESLRYHAERNHFSNWLRARTEFWLAHKLRPRKVSDFASMEELRQDLIRSLREYRRLCQRGIVTDFNKDTFDPNTSFARIGGGSLGGKARGLAFVNILINNYNVQNFWPNVTIDVPAALAIGTDVFDEFLEENNLRSFALSCDNDEEICRRFLLASRFPERILGDLAAFLDLMHAPLAVRSSSLLEDSQYHPFAGVYHTYMIPNNHPDPIVRLGQLLRAIKRVYASTFFQAPKEYIKATSYRLEEEKMAVVIQKLVGSQHGDRFYPAFSGVARSYNFYPVGPQKPSEGVASVALGLGKMIVEGGTSVRFSPAHPDHLPQFATITDTLHNSQRDFYALSLAEDQYHSGVEDLQIKRFDIRVAEQDGVLGFLASTYSPENDCIYDGISREGRRLVTFAPILKDKIFPLPQIIELLLDMGSWGMGTPVEIEFAADMCRKPYEFGLLQLRPFVLNRELEELTLEEVPEDELLISSNSVLGHGVMNDIYDIVVVDRDLFERSRSRQTAQEISRLNAELLADHRPYLLIALGRLGTLDPWLGIPVTWDQICGARAIVETDFKDMPVSPSQGSHFFHNLTSFSVGYFSINGRDALGKIDWEWLNSQQPALQLNTVKLLRFDSPLTIKINGRENRGYILKPKRVDP